MYDYLFLTFAVAFAAAFVLLLLKKWGIVEWLQVHGSDLISRMANCDFCLSWWLCLIVSAILCLTTQNPLTLLTSILATPITRKLQ